MTQADLPNIRKLAQNGQISYTEHALDQMNDRNIFYDDVEDILGSSTNQLIEVQSPSSTPGKTHQDERILISDPAYPSAIIVIIVILFLPLPCLRVITVEHALDERWIKNSNDNPWLIRK